MDRQQKARIEFRTDKATKEKALEYKEALGYSHNDIYKIGLDTICTEKKLLKARLSNINEQNRILKQTIENNHREAFKIRYSLYLKNPRDLNPKDTNKLYRQFVKNYLDDLKIYCLDSWNECLRIIKTEPGTEAIRQYAEDYKLDFDKLYNMILEYLENNL